ncbi:spermidine/putrescine ABC transporter substrate-binding protein [Rhodobacter sp.]
MKKAMIYALPLALAAGTLQAEGTLALYNWGDYINPEILTKFTEETGIAVTLDTYSSNEEMLAKIQAGATGYDIVFPSVWMQDVMLKLDLLQQTDINQDPAFVDIDKAFLRSKEDPESAYCLPYAWGTVGIFYNEDITGPITGWTDFFQIPEKTGGKITMLDDMREVMSVGLIMTGHDINSTDPDEVAEAAAYISERKKHLTAFTYEIHPLLLSGDLVAAHGFVGGMMFYQDKPNMKYVIPADGGTMYQENVCVLKTAPNKEAAQKFLQFYLRPDIAALNVAQQFNGTPNTPANELTPEAIRTNPNINVSAETRERLQILEDLGAAMKLYDRAWNAIRTAQ